MLAFPRLSSSTLPERVKAHQRERQAVLITKEAGVYVNQQRGSQMSFGTDTHGLFLLPVLSTVVCLAALSVYMNLLHITPMDHYAVPATPVLLDILLVIAVGMVGALQHWR